LRLRTGVAALAIIESEAIAMKPCSYAMRDEILDEIRAARRKISQECDFDFGKMFERFRKAQQRCRPELIVREKVAKSDPDEGLGVVPCL
jgi:hypothetical protein